MKKKIDVEKLLNTLNKLKGCILIVEGIKDEKALKTLELRNIIRISGKPLIRIVDEVTRMIQSHHQDVIILTDFDSEGKRIASKLTCLLQVHKIHPNSRLRSEVMKLGWNKIEDMNGLRFELPMRQIFTGGDVHVKIGTNIDKVHDKSEDKGERRSRKTRHNRSDIRPD